MTGEAEQVARALGYSWWVKRWGDSTSVRGMFIEPTFNLPWEPWDGVEPVAIAQDWERHVPDFRSPDGQALIIADIERRGWGWALTSTSGVRCWMVSIWWPESNGVRSGSSLDSLADALISAYLAATGGTE